MSQQHTWLVWKSSEAETQMVPMSPHFQTLKSVADQLWTTTGAVPRLPRTGRIFHLGALWRGMFLRQGSNSTWGRLLLSHNLAAAAHPSDPKGICTHSFELFHYKDPKCSSPSIHNHFLLPNMAKTLLESFSVSSALLTPKPNPGEEQSFGGTQRRGCHGLLSEHIERLFQDLKTFFTPITSKISWEFPSTFPGKEKPKHSFTSVDVKPLSFFFFFLVWLVTICYPSNPNISQRWFREETLETPGLK